MLQKSTDGSAMWVEKSIDRFSNNVQLTAEDQNYAQWPPEVELPYAVTDLSEGAGIAEQDPRFRHRYHYALYADCSNGRPVKGPLFNSQQTLTLASSTPTQMIEFNSKAYLISGPLMFRRDDDTGAGWVAVTVPGTFAGKTIGKCSVFRGTNSADLLFIPIGTSANYYVMNAAETFTQHASQKAEQFEVIGDTLWLATTTSNQRVIQNSFDGGTAATWGGANVVGDSFAGFTWMRTVQDRLLCMKEDGVFAPSDAGFLDEDLTPQLRSMKAAGNGAGAIAWNNLLVFPFADQLYKFNPDTGQLEQFGPETLEQNGSEVKGPVQSVSEHGNNGLFAGMYNATNGHSYLAKYGTWRTTTTAAGSTRQFIPAWHFALMKWTSKRVCLLHITNVISGGPRLYAVFTDGSVEWCLLARTASVKDDPNYRFNTANTGEVYYPRFTAGFPFEPKLLKAVGIAGNNLSSGARTVGAEYKFAEDTSYTSIGSTGTTPGERLEPSGSPASAALDLKATLTTTASTSSPELTAFVIYSALRTNTTALKDITCTLQVHDSVTDRAGKPMKYSWEEIRDAIEGSITAQGSISVITPKGETITAIGVQFAESMISVDSDGSRVWAMTIRMIQTKITFTRGTWARAGVYTWDTLASFSWAELAHL